MKTSKPICPKCGNDTLFYTISKAKGLVHYLFDAKDLENEQDNCDMYQSVHTFGKQKFECCNCRHQFYNKALEKVLEGETNE